MLRYRTTTTIFHNHYDDYRNFKLDSIIPSWKYVARHYLKTGRLGFWISYFRKTAPFSFLGPAPFHLKQMPPHRIPCIDYYFYSTNFTRIRIWCNLKISAIFFSFLSNYYLWTFRSIDTNSANTYNVLRSTTMIE